MTLRLFPVLFPPGYAATLRALDCPAFVPWSSLNDGWAYQNHNQNLEQLARRGGLDPSEIAAVAQKRQYQAMSTEAAVEFVKGLAAKIAENL